MSQLNFNPAARMVDTFAAPEVRLSNDGTALQQLASSLQSLQPSLQRYADVATQEERKQRLEEAYDFIREREVTNMGQLKKLVDAGELDENSNPWKLRLVNRLVAKREFAAVASQIEADLLQDPAVRDSDDFGFVQQETLRRLNERMPELDVQTAATLAGDYEGFVQDFVGRHAARRVGERELNAQEAFVTELTQQLSGSPAAMAALVDGSSRPEIQALADATVNGLQNTLNTLERTTSAPKVRAYAVSAVVQAAVEARNPKVAEVLLSRLTVAGSPVGSIVSPAQMAEIREKVTRAEIDEFRLSAARDSLVDEQGLTAVYSALEQAAGRGENLANVKIPMDGLTPEGRLKVNSFREAIDRRRAEEKFGEAAAAVMTGTFDDREVEFELAFIAFGYPGQEAYGRLRQFQNLRESNVWGTTSPARKIEIDSIVRSEDSTASKRDRLVSLAAGGRMSEADFNSAYNRIVQQSTPSGRAVESMVQSARAQFLTYATSGLMSDPSNMAPSLDPTKAPELRAEAEGELRIAVSDLDAKLWNFLSQNPEADAATLDAFIRESVDEASRSIGGFGRDDYSANLQLIRTRDKLLVQPVVTDFRGSLFFENGQFAVRAGGNTAAFPGSPRLFSDPADFDARVDNVLQDLGAGFDLKQAVAVLQSQLSVLGKSDKALRRRLEAQIREYSDFLQSEQSQPTGPVRPLPGAE
jgi:hypothetical protein